jgi:hypothetical protein
MGGGVRVLKDKEGLIGAGRRGQVVGASRHVAGLAGGTLAAAGIANGQWQKANGKGPIG